MPIARSFVPLAFVVIAVSCSPRPFDAAGEETKLLKRDAEWADAASAGKDLDKIVSYWSDDAVVIPEGQPTVEGKAAIRAFVASSLQIPGFKIHWTSEKVRFSPDGKLAYMRGMNEIAVPGPQGTPTTLQGRGTTIWRLDSDGQWRCVLDIWNGSPAAAPAST